MKKIISIALLLAMVLGLFAACGEQNATNPGNDALDSAVAYLKNMYDKSTKDEDNKLTADKELIPAVTIAGVSYPINWSISVTSGPADAIVIAEGASAGTQKIDIVTQPEEEVRFVLTATISDANGNSKTLDLKFYSPAVQKVEVEEGQKVVIYLVSDGKYMTGVDYLYTSSSGSQKHELGLSAEKADAVALTLKTNADGTVSFVTDNGMYLFCDATNVQFVSEPSDNTLFVLEAAEGGQLIKCAIANFNDKPQYLEVYSGYMTCYGISETSNLALYIFELQDAEGAMGTVGEPAAPCEHTYVDGACSACGAADPNYIPPAGPQLPEISAPVAGTTYKFGVVQVNTGNTIYISGAIDQDRYLVTTTDKSAALDVTIEEVDGGIKIATTIDGAKVYIALFLNAAGKTALGYNAEGSVFKFDATTSCWYTNLDGTDYYMGCYNQFETISPSKTSYISAENAGITQFPAGFFAAEEATVSNLPDVMAPIMGVTYKFGMVQVNTGNVVYIAGGIDQDRYLVTTTDKAAGLDVTIEEVDGGIKIATTIDGAKAYIALFLNAAGKTALGYNAEGSVFKFDAATFCWYTNLDGTDYYMGSYNQFETVSASKTSYISADNTGVTQFPAGFFSLGGNVQLPGEETPETPETPAQPSGNPLVSGTKVVLYMPSVGKALSSVKNKNDMSGVDVTLADGVLSGYGATEIFVVIVNADGTISFEQNGQKIGMQDTYASMSLGSVNDTWQVIDLGNSLYNIKNVVRGQYMDWYNGKFSTYTPADPASDPAYQMAFYIVG